MRGNDAGIEDQFAEAGVRERRAYICEHSDCKPPKTAAPERRFLSPGDPDVRPRCTAGHLMVKIANVPYKGSKP